MTDLAGRIDDDRAMRAVDLDKTAMEAALGNLDEQVSRLAGLLREHAEQLAPILRPEGEDSTASHARPMEMSSERVAQIHSIADRVELMAEGLAGLTRRVEA